MRVRRALPERRGATLHEHRPSGPLMSSPARRGNSDGPHDVQASMTRVASGILGAVLCTLAAGCGVAGHRAPTTTATTKTSILEGVITGRATPCHPQATGAGLVAVTVTISTDGKTVAVQTVSGMDAYRLTVPPGLYTVSSSAVGTTPVHNLRVEAGAIDRVNILSDCV